MFKIAGIFVLIVVGLSAAGVQAATEIDIDGVWTGSGECSGSVVDYQFRLAGFRGLVTRLVHLPDGDQREEHKVFIPVRSAGHDVAEFRIDDGRENGDWRALLKDGLIQVNEGSRMDDCTPFTLSFRAPASEAMYANPAAPAGPLRALASLAKSGNTKSPPSTPGKESPDTTFEQKVLDAECAVARRFTYETEHLAREQGLEIDLVWSIYLARGLMSKAALLEHRDIVQRCNKERGMKLYFPSEDNLM